MKPKIQRQELLAGELILKPYLAGVEPELFRLIQKNLDDLVPSFPQMLSATRTAEDTKEYVQAKTRLWNKNEAFGFLLFHKGRIVGHFNLKDIDWKQKQLEFSYWLDASLRGRGWMSGIIRVMLRFGFEKLGMERISARVVTTNAASERVLQKSGFKYEGTYHQAYRTFDNRDVDTHVYAISRQDWLKMPMP